MGKTHTVAEGDTMISIADQYGFGYWETVYYDPSNAALREKCPDPLALIVGETVNIPDKKLKPVPAQTNKKHTFVVHRLRAQFRLALHDQIGRPRAGLDYRLEIGGRSFNGTTGPDGLIEHEVPASAKEGTLYLILDDEDPDAVMSLPVRIGGLPPVSDTRGVQTRLNNLGYDCGVPDGTLNEKTCAAIQAFKHDYFHFTQPTDHLDEQTLSLIEALGGK